MTDATRDIPLTEDWLPVSAPGAVDFSATLEGDRAFGALIRIAGSKPALSIKTGHRLSALTPSMQIPNIKAGLSVWARAVSGKADLCVS